MNKFLIYAEGGVGVCLGHIMRMLTLADALSNKGITVYFASCTEEGIAYLKHAGYEVIKIDNLNYKKIAELGKEIGVDGVIVDKFGFTYEQHQLLVNEIGYLVHIDDFMYNGPANLVINSTIDQPPANVERYSRWLCGGKYALIRKQFSRTLERHHKLIPEKLLLTTGYCDPVNFHLRAIKLIGQVYPNLEIHLVVGGGFTTINDLESLRKKTRLILHTNVTDMSGLMYDCDMAVSAGGTTLYELSATGLPTVAISLYDNQIDNLRRVAKNGCVLSLGWHEGVTDSDILDNVAKVYQSIDLRKKLSSVSTTWIDGEGADRIATAIYNDLISR